MTWVQVEILILIILTGIVVFNGWYGYRLIKRKKKNVIHHLQTYIAIFIAAFMFYVAINLFIDLINHLHP